MIYATAMTIVASSTLVRKMFRNVVPDIADHPHYSLDLARIKLQEHSTEKHIHAISP